MRGEWDVQVSYMKSFDWNYPDPCPTDKYQKSSEYMILHLTVLLFPDTVYMNSTALVPKASLQDWYRSNTTTPYATFLYRQEWKPIEYSKLSTYQDHM